MNSSINGMKFLSAFALVLGALLLCACPRVDPVDPVGPEGPDTPGPETPSGPYFNLLSTSDSFPIPPNHTVVYNRDATGSTFRVRTNIDDWKAVPSASWCTAHKDGQGNLVVLVEEYGDLATHETLPPRICRVSVEACVRSMLRKVSLKSGKVTIKDSYSLSESKKPADFNWLTWGDVDISAPGKVIITVQEETLTLNYDEKRLKPIIETIVQDDPPLRRTWGDKIYRVTLREIKSSLKGSYTFTVMPSAK